MARRMHRYRVPVDDQAYPFPLVVGNEIVRVECTDNVNVVEFWIEDEDERTVAVRWLQVFSTGQPLPDDGRCVGTTGRHPSFAVWHLFEVAKPELS